MGDVLNRGTKKRPLWYCRYRDEKGQRRQKATNQPTRALALLRLAELEAAVSTGPPREIVEASPGSSSTTTVRDLVARFLEEYAAPRIKDLHDYRRQARSIFKVRVIPALGHRIANTITGDDVERLRDRLIAKKYSAESVSHTLKALSTLYRFARKAKLIDCNNPVQGIERPRSIHSIDYFTKEEVAKVLVYTEEHAPMLHVAIAVAVYCGLRKGELFGLRWNDVALDALRLDVNRSYRTVPKSGKARHVPIHPECARILRLWQASCPETSEELVFPIKNKQRRSYRMGARNETIGLGELLRAAGCRVFKKPWHALRHTFAAHAVMSGASLYGVQHLLGHASPAMTQRYAHLAPDYLASEVSRISFEMPVPWEVSRDVVAP